MRYYACWGHELETVENDKDGPARHHAGTHDPNIWRVSNGIFLGRSV